MTVILINKEITLVEIFQLCEKVSRSGIENMTSGLTCQVKTVHA